MRFRGVLLVCFVFFSAAAGAKEKPLFEFGVVGGGGYFPDYPAADESHFDGLALPYVVYRGKFLRAGDKGLVRGRFVHTRDLEFDVSVSGSVPADSDDNDARRGMPDLDYLVQVGPRVQWTMARAAKWAKIDLEVPVRAVFSTDLSEVDFRGVLFAPEIAYQHERFLDSPYEVKFSVGVNFATEKLHDYFYEVPAQFVAPARPAFDADAGYLGARLKLLVKRNLGKRFIVFAGGAVNLHSGAANEASPLFRDELTFGLGGGVIWKFFRSKATVDE